MPKAKNMQNPTSENQVLDQVVEIIRFMGENKLAEIDLETSEMKLSLKKHSAIQYQTVQVSSQTPAVVAEPVKTAKSANTAPKAPEAEPKHNYQSVVSPMTGTFYRAPSPSSEPFIKEGDSVKAGQTICIVEAMKMMNEIKSDKTGKIVKILLDNGKPVEKGTVLVHVEA